jgi:hypothetical protein
LNRVFCGFTLLIYSCPTGLGATDHFLCASGDILDKGKIYAEFDVALLFDASAGTYTPRLVVGIGRKIEIGINLNGIPSPGL